MDINSIPVPNEPVKKILFIITQSEFGGAQHFLYNLLSRLDRKRFEPLVAVGSDGDKELLQALNEINIPHRIIPRLKRDNNPINDLIGVHQIRSLIKEYRPSTVFLNSSKAGFLGSLAAQLTPGYIKVVYRIGGWTFNDPWPVLQKKLWITLERIGARWKDVIVVNNEHDLIQAKQLHIKPRNEITLIHNGIDPYIISP
ncbi:glycosyltransferase, partial [Candidatus Parcubacteria bacterium]|nr:glycosyltransferase [Candidatus Parcubacteria bacterium]